MANFKDTQPFLMNGGRIDPLSEIRNAGIITNGDVYWVKKTTDPDYVTFQDQVGNDYLRSDIQSAIDITTSDQNDYIMVTPADGGTAYSQGTALDINEDKLHIIGVGQGRGKANYGITVLSTQGTVPDTELVYVTGHGVEVSGIRFLGTLGTNDGGTMSNGVLYLAGHDFWAHDCTIEDSTAAWGETPLINGKGSAAHDAHFDRCDIVQSGTTVEASTTGLIVGGGINRRWVFNDCDIRMTAGSVLNTFIQVGTGAKYYTQFNNCRISATGTSIKPNCAVSGSILANNPVLFNNCSLFAVSAFGTDPNVYAIPTQAGTAAAGLHNPNVYYLGTVGVAAA